VINVRVEREGAKVVFGWMEQPLPERLEFTREAELLSCLGLERAELPILEYDNGPRHVIVVIDRPSAVAELRPDMRRLAQQFPQLISVAAGSGTRYKTRVFAPSDGVAEDPATGSAAGPLAVHLARHDRIVYGEYLTIAQGAELARPSELHAIVHGSHERLDRVEVGGAAVVLGRGELRL